MFKLFFKKNKQYKLLAIETSCDDTAMCLVEFKKGHNNFKILNNFNFSQIAIHNQYGGVYPHLAKMEHLKNLPIILLATLNIEINTTVEDNIKNNLKIESTQELYKFFDNLPNILSQDIYQEFLQKIKQIKYIAVTTGPGLSPSLWTGIEFAKLIHKYNKADIYNVNHMEGHIFSGIIKSYNNIDNNEDINNNNNTKNNSDSTQDNIKEIKIIDNALSLLISGGHTEIIHCKNNNQKYNDFNYTKIGQTLDDAVGECYDKTARALGLPYPGGPEISRLSELAKNDNKKIINQNLILPRPMINSKDYDFSFSGLKTAVINRIQKYSEFINSNQEQQQLFCREFENAVSEVIIKKMQKAIIEYKVKNIIVGGGVSANTNIRTNIENIAKINNLNLFLPDKGLSMDNALMIAAVGINKINLNKKPNKIKDIKAISRWSIEEV